MGPAFVAAIGYIDPGNFATNIQAGASFGYQLLWVVVWANLMAMLIGAFCQTGHCHRQARPSRSATITRVLLSGFTGYRRKLSLWPPIWLNLSAPQLVLSWYSAYRFCRGGADRGGDFSDPDAAAARAKTTGEGDRWIVAVCRRGLCRGVDLFPARAGSSDERAGDPHAAQREAVFLAAGVLGATIMPHVIYLHSSLTQHLHGGTRKERYNATRWDVAIAMTIAGFVNLAMMATPLRRHSTLMAIPASPISIRPT